MSQNSSDTQETSKVGFIFHVDIRHKPKYVEADLLELHKLLYEKIDLDNEINKDLIENYIAKLKFFKKMEYLADKITITENSLCRKMDRVTYPGKLGAHGCTGSDSAFKWLVKSLGMVFERKPNF